jgi:hypothetical protein
VLKQFAFVGLFGVGLALNIAAAETPAKIGPEEPSISNPGITLSDWYFSCANNTNGGPSGNPCAYDYSPTFAYADEGKMRFICDPSHLDYSDPILLAGKPGFSHLHHFFGNPSTNAYSTYRSLRQTTVQGTCAGGPLNNTAYWYPAMINGGQNKVQVPDYIELYYAVGNRGEIQDESSATLCPGNGNDQAGRPTACPNYAATRFERGMKFIAGHVASTGENPSSYPAGLSDSIPYSWSCGGFGALKYAFWDADTPSNGIQGCTAGTQLQVRLVTPNCWDGTYGSGNFFTHLSYEFEDGNGFPSCPQSHPYRLAQITVIITWSHNGESDYSTWYLSSDRYNGATFPGGQTFHTDWFGAWEDSIQDAWQQEMNGMHPGSLPYTTPNTSTHVRHGSDGLIGNDTQMKQSTIGISTSALGEPARYLDIPTQLKSGGKSIRAKGGKVR